MDDKRWGVYASNTLKTHDQGHAVSVSCVDALIRIGSELLECGCMSHFYCSLLDNLKNIKEELTRRTYGKNCTCE